MRTITENLIFFGLGAINLTRERARLMVNDLVARGEVEKEEAAALVERLMEKGKVQRDEMKNMLQEELRKMVHNTAEEERFAALEERLRTLEEKMMQSHQ